MVILLEESIYLLPFSINQPKTRSKIPALIKKILLSKKSKAQSKYLTIIKTKREKDPRLINQSFFFK